ANVTMSISPKTAPVYFIQGKPLTLTCTVRGDVNADVKWVKSELPLDDVEYQIESWNDEDEHGPKKNVKITKASAGPQDASFFRCYSDSVDATAETADLYVVVRDANITEGSDTTLTCKLELPYIRNSISWYKEGTPLEEIPDLKGRVEIGNNTVVFRNAKLTDSGAYTCRLEILTDNKELVQVFQEKVVLQGKPYIANWNNPELNQQVTNSSILLKCPAGGYPPPTVNWFRDPEVIVATDHIRLTSLNGLSSGQLEISNTTAADYGQYKCTAENALGSASLTFDVTGAGTGNSGFRAMLGLVDIFGLSLGISIAFMTLSWSR
ncbi:unnamed protein product, partial [Candidula unifasciata]